MDGATPDFLMQAPSWSDWFALTSGLVGAIFGATLSGFFSNRLARRTLREADRRDLAARVEADKAKIMSVQMKASIILSDIVATADAIDASLDNANANGVSPLAPLWQRVGAIVGSSPPTDFTTTELAPLIAAKEYELVAELIELSMQNRVLDQSIEEYSALRMQLRDYIHKSQVASGSVLLSALTTEELERLQPRFVELESLMRSIRTRIQNLRPKAERITKAVGPAARKHFGDPEFPVMEVVTR